jgi:hypothetical protein
MAEEGVIKWVWGSLGLCICAIPVFAGEMLGMKTGDLGSRTEGEAPLNDPFLGHPMPHADPQDPVDVLDQCKELRFTHSRLLESAEEVALYHGEEFEKNVIERGYFALVKHVNRVLRIRVASRQQTPEWHRCTGRDYPTPT